MARLILTDQAISRAAREAKGTGRRTELTDASQSGLRLKIAPSGIGHFILLVEIGMGGCDHSALAFIPT